MPCPPVGAPPPQEWYATDAELLKRRGEGPNHLYKTSMCKNYVATGGEGGGVCPYGEDCAFAHGPADIRKPDFFKRQHFQQVSAQPRCRHPCTISVLMELCRTSITKQPLS